MHEVIIVDADSNNNIVCINCAALLILQLTFHDYVCVFTIVTVTFL